MLAVAEQSISLSTWGIILLAGLTLIGPAIAIAMLVMTWLRDKREQERRNRQETEPRHSPTIDQKINERLLVSEQRLVDRIGKVEADCKTEDHKLHGRISGLRDEMSADWDRTARDIRTSVETLRDSVSTVRDSVSEMAGSLKHVNAHVQVVDTELRRHIEKDKS